MLFHHAGFFRVFGFVMLTSLLALSQLGFTGSSNLIQGQSSHLSDQLVGTPTASNAAKAPPSPASPTTSSISGTCVSSWPQFHGDSAHSGFSCSNGPLTNTTSWTYQLGGSNTALIAPGSGELVASSILDGANGGCNPSPPCITKGGEVVAFRENGTRLFSFFQHYQYLGTAYPASGGGLIYFATYIQPWHYTACFGTCNPYFDPPVWYVQADYVSTGAAAYEFSMPSPPNCETPGGINPVYNTCNSFYGDGLLADYNGSLVQASYNTGQIGEYMASNGNQLWPATVKSTVDTIPTGGNGVVAVGYSNSDNLTAISTLTGKAAWNFTQASSRIQGTPAFGNGNFYFATGATVYSVSSTSGGLVWSKTPAGATPGSFAVDSTPALAYGLVYLGGDDNHIYALNATTGSTVWTFTAGGAFIASPAVSSNKVLYDGSADGYVYALNATTGKLLWSYNTGSPLTSGPVLDSGALFAVNQKGKIFAFPDPAPATLGPITPLPQWPQFQGGAAHTGSSLSIGPVTPLNLWTIAVGGSNDAIIADLHQIIVSSPQINQLVALAEQNGSRLFSYFLNRGLGTAYPASGGALVFF
jgi:hypothetical protein